MRGVSLDSHAVYVRPKPEVVADVWDYSSPEAAAERWHWLPMDSLAKLAVEGRHIKARRAGLTPRTSAARSTTPEFDAAVVEAVLRHGLVSHAAAEFSVSFAVVYRILRERSIPVPKVDRTLAALRAAETRRQRAAA